MQENSYIQVLIQSLHQKVEALDSIIEKNQEQYEILSAEEADMDAFEKNIGTFERLRYSFGGDRPSQTAHLILSSASLLLELDP